MKPLAIWKRWRAWRRFDEGAGEVPGHEGLRRLDLELAAGIDAERGTPPLDLRERVLSALREAPAPAPPVPSLTFRRTAAVPALLAATVILAVLSQLSFRPEAPPPGEGDPAAVLGRASDEVTDILRRSSSRLRLDVEEPLLNEFRHLSRDGEMAARSILDSLPTPLLEILRGS